jgi:hypothetical protein
VGLLPNHHPQWLHVCGALVVRTQQRGRLVLSRVQKELKALTHED